MTHSARKSSRLLLTCALALALFGLTMVVLTLVPELQAQNRWLAMAASFAPYGLLAWALAVVLALIGSRGRTRLIAIPLAVGLAGQAVMLTGYLPAAPAVAAGATSVKVLELNLRFGLADLNELAEDVERFRPDVMVLTEVTQSNAAAFESSLWRKLLPYRVGAAGRNRLEGGLGDASGTVVLSRHRLTQLKDGRRTLFTNFATKVDLPDAPFVLVAAHPSSPARSLDYWLSDSKTVTAIATRHAGGRLIVAGDLNATAEHLTLRELAAKARLTDAGSGYGWHPTYPADTWYPPLIQIDHVLVSAQFTTTAYRTVRVAGTDHLGLMVTLSVR